MCRLVEAFGSTRRVRQLKAREEGAVKGSKLGDQGVLAALLAQVNRVAAVAGETREQVGAGVGVGGSWGEVYATTMGSRVFPLFLFCKFTHPAWRLVDGGVPARFVGFCAPMVPVFLAIGKYGGASVVRSGRLV